MDFVAEAERIEARYRSYLSTAFYFRDPDFRASFESELRSGHLRRGPYLEATPIFRRGDLPDDLLTTLLRIRLDEGFVSAIVGSRRLYKHQEEAIRRVLLGENTVVATGTGSGKTEAFLYPILGHLYQEFVRGTLGAGVR